MKTKISRKSNIELLRIISMIMILILHADLFANGSPSATEIINNPLTSWIRIHLECLSIVAVNVFVLISGWFGINIKIKSIINILFQCLYFSILAIIFTFFYDKSKLTFNHIIQQLYIGEGYWFVVSYIGLIIISPILNTFVENCSKKQIISTLILFYIYQIIYGWFMFDEAHFEYGYSLLSFIGLYLIARYIRINPNPLFCLNKKNDFGIYFLLSIILATLYCLISYTDNHDLIIFARYKIIAYNNPLVVISSVYLLLGFAKITINSNIINWLAASCFSIYLIHCNPLLFDEYLQLMKHLYTSFTGLKCFGVLLSSLLSISLISILIDQIRKTMWNIIINHIDN